MAPVLIVALWVNWRRHPQRSFFCMVRGNEHSAMKLRSGWACPVSVDSFSFEFFNS